MESARGTRENAQLSNELAETEKLTASNLSAKILVSGVVY